MSMSNNHNKLFFKVTFSAKLKPAEKVTFHLRYEELLQRTDKGLYKYQVNVQPKNQKIPDFVFKVNIDESLPLKKISVWREKEKSGGKSQREEITSEALTHDEKSSPNYAYVDILPNDANNNGKDWTFQVQYDVERLVCIQLIFMLECIFKYLIPNNL